MRQPLCLHLLSIAICVTTIVPPSFGNGIYDVVYRAALHDQVYDVSDLTTIPDVSRLECSRLCSKIDSCTGYVIPVITSTPSEHVTCDLQGPVEVPHTTLSRLNVINYKKICPASCDSIHDANPSSSNDYYFIHIDGFCVRLYCDMAAVGSAIPHQYLPPASVPFISQDGLDQLFTDRSQVKVVFSYTDLSTDSSTILTQLSTYASTLLRIDKHSADAFTVSFVPDVVHLMTNGMTINGWENSFENCDPNSNSYVKFQQSTDALRSSTTTFQGYQFSRDFLNHLEAIAIGATPLPREMFYFGEVAFGGCGCLALTDTGAIVSGIALAIN